MTYIILILEYEINQNPQDSNNMNCIRGAVDTKISFTNIFFFNF